MLAISSAFTPTKELSHLPSWVQRDFVFSKQSLALLWTLAPIHLESFRELKLQ
jgi:peroxiredoxin